VSAAKSAPTTEHRNEAWLSKSAAARFLGVSERQIERREQQGYIEKRVLPRDPHESMARVEYSRADLEALKAGKPNMYAREVSNIIDRSRPVNETGKLGDLAHPLSQTALAIRGRPAGVDGFAALAAHLARLSAAYAPAEAVPWLSLRDAAKYSGLPRRYLLDAARDGALFARDVSVGGARSRWMFNREALGRL